MCQYVYIHIYMYIHDYVHIRIFICKYIFIYVHAYIYSYCTRYLRPWIVWWRGSARGSWTASRLPEPCEAQGRLLCTIHQNHTLTPGELAEWDLAASRVFIFCITGCLVLYSHLHVTNNPVVCHIKKRYMFIQTYTLSLKLWGKRLQQASTMHAHKCCSRQRRVHTPEEQRRRST